MNRIRLLLFMSLCISCFSMISQSLKPGFDKNEFIELLKIGARTTADSGYYNHFPAPQQYKLVYQSPTVGLDNLWQLWVNDAKVAVITLRGTTTNQVSFLVNLYAAMVAAKGELQLEKEFNFKYTLSHDPKAAVHVGFLISTAYLSRDILPRIDSCYKNGIKNFIIAGHSQGGALTYLLTSYLESLKEEKRLPDDIRFKTCASAAPKPGNLYYAYSFENLTRNGWAYNVVNCADWVPEVPFSVQTVNDFNMTNPFRNAKRLIRKQKFPANLALRHVYNKLSKPAKKAQRNYEKYLGKMISRSVKKNISGFKPPAYYKSNHYVRTGVTITLYPTKEYFNIYPDNSENVWHHHFQAPYLFLTEKLPN